MATNAVISDIFVKMRIIISMKHLAINDYTRAAKLLTLTLEDINSYGISHVSYNRQININDALRNALVFTNNNLNGCAINELKKAGLEIDMDDLVRKHLVLRESDSDLNIIPYNIRLKIANYI